MSGRPTKLYSVWANDDKDTLIALDETAETCAALMGVKTSVFRQYITRPNKSWTIRARKGKKDEQIDDYR